MICELNNTHSMFLFVIPEPVGLFHCINQPATGGNWIKVILSGCYVQSPWTQTGQHGAMCKESYPGSYGGRVSAGGHSNLEQSEMVRYKSLPPSAFRTNWTLSSFRLRVQERWGWITIVRLLLVSASIMQNNFHLSHLTKLHCDYRSLPNQIS